MDGLLLVDKPAGPTSHDVVAAACAARAGRRPEAARRPRRDARPVRHRPAARPRRPRHAHPAVRDAAAARPMRPSRASARRRPRATCEGEITETGVVPDGDLALPTGRLRQLPHNLQRGTRQRSPGLRARAGGEDFELAARDVEVDVFEELWRDGDRAGLPRSSARPAPTCARSSSPRRRPLRRAAAHARSGPFSVDDAGTPESRGLSASRTPCAVPASRRALRRRRAGRPHGRAVAGAAGGTVVLRRRRRADRHRRARRRRPAQARRRLPRR